VNLLQWQNIEQMIPEPKVPKSIYPELPVPKQTILSFSMGYSLFRELGFPFALVKDCVPVPIVINKSVGLLKKYINFSMLLFGTKNAEIILF
jgi:hypothetical protein